MQPTSFYHLGIAPKLLGTLDRLKFTLPTPIQHQAIPVALEGKDIVGVAQTGTGKTLAFGIPLVQQLSTTRGRALVLAPTRELAIQIDEVLRQILPSFGLSSVVLIGGAPMFRQVKTLQRNPRVIIATPGRLIDHMQQRTVHLKDVHILVLDEADRMFDMGFAPQVERILQSVPKDRQTMLFSATMPDGIVKLATRHMKLPINVEIAPSGTAADRVTQELFIVREESKRALLKALLTQYRGSVLLFTRTKIKARKITFQIRDLGHSVDEIHSDRSMAQRKRAIENFKSGRSRILVATDIASRGIDVSMIELVINYDLPEEIENYVHRIGRTGRAGNEGIAISFATPDQSSEVSRIERLIRKTLKIVKHPELTADAFPARSSFPGSSRGGGHRRAMFKPRRRSPHRRRI